MTGPVEEEEEEWSYWDHPEGGKHVSAVTRVLPLPLTETPPSCGTIPSTSSGMDASHNTAQQRHLLAEAEAFLWLKGVATVPTHRDEGKCVVFLSIRVYNLATGSSFSVLCMTCTIQSCLKWTLNDLI